MFQVYNILQWSAENINLNNFLWMETHTIIYNVYFTSKLVGIKGGNKLPSYKNDCKESFINVSYVFHYFLRGRCDRMVIGNMQSVFCNKVCQWHGCLCTLVSSAIKTNGRNITEIYVYTYIRVFEIHRT